MVKFGMQKLAKILLVVVAVLLILNGLLNIIDDGRVLTYDIASILSGAGLAITNFLLPKKR
jgi:hypothetical protein